MFPVSQVPSDPGGSLSPRTQTTERLEASLSTSQRDLSQQQEDSRLAEIAIEIQHAYLTYMQGNCQLGLNQIKEICSQKRVPDQLKPEVQCIYAIMQESQDDFGSAGSEFSNGSAQEAQGSERSNLDASRSVFSKSNADSCATS